MGKRRKHNRTQVQGDTIQKSFSLEDLERLGQEIEVRKHLEIEKALRSTDPHAIMTAQAFLHKQNKQGDFKSYFFDPDINSLNTNGYRTPTKGVSYNVLRKMAKNPVIRTIIGTRTDQVAGFSEPVDNDQERGWCIRKKKVLFEKEDQVELTDDEKRTIERITKFIQNGGETEDSKWEYDGFEEMLRQMVNDSLTVDQVCIENVYTRGGDLCQFYPVDASTIRLVDQSDTVRLAGYTKPVKGVWPRYCQVWEDNITAFYYPWEMTFGVRNKLTDIKANGYGVSELEDMVQIVTWLLFGMQYNGNFFSQGSNPKGFFSIKGNVPPSALNDFKQMWRNTQTGVWNAHRIPVIESGGAEINWTNMMGGNMKDMEFHKWLEFLITLSCCIFRIDPSECGFSLEGQKGIFGQDGQKERLKHSQSKGLIPILKLLQRLLTKYIVEPLDENYEFVFCGVETDDQQVALDMDVKKVEHGFMSMEDGFKKWSGRDFDPENDTILSSVYMQIKQAEQMGGDMMNGMVDGMDQMGGEPEIENPFEKALLNYLNEDLPRSFEQ